MKRVIMLTMLMVSLLICKPALAQDSVDSQVMNNTIEGTKAKIAKEYEKAIDFYNKAIQLDPNNVETILWRSECYYHLERYSEALSDVEAALILNPRNEYAIASKACYYSISNDKENALKYLQQVISMNGKWKTWAANEIDFENIKDSIEFQNLIGITVRIDGQLWTSDIAPMINDGRTLIPLRVIFEALGAKVEWNGETKTIKSMKDNTSIALTIDKNEATINDNIIKLEVPPIIDNGRTYVPLRFVSEALGASVNWIADSSEACITTADNTPINQAEAAKVTEDLKKTINVSTIKGSIVNPYILKKDEALVLMIAKTHEDFSAFQSLGDEDKKQLLNDYISAQPNRFKEFQKVYVYFVYQGKRYAETVTILNSNSNALTLYEYKQGIDTNVVVQDTYNLFYYDYYMNKKPLYKRVNAAIDAVGEEMEDYDIFFNDRFYKSISYPQKWTVESDKEMVVFYAPLDGSSDDFADNVNIRVERISKEVMQVIVKTDDFIKFQDELAKKNLTDVKMEKKEVLAEGSTANVYHFVYTFKEGATNLKGDTKIVAYNNGVMFYYELVCEPQNYDKYVKLFGIMLQTEKNHPKDAV